MYWFHFFNPPLSPRGLFMLGSPGAQIRLDCVLYTNTVHSIAHGLDGGIWNIVLCRG